MKKLIKKFAAAFFAFAFVAAGIVAVKTQDVAAADGDYFILGTVPGAAWDASSTATMVDNGDGTFTYTTDSATVGTSYMFKIANKAAFGTGNWGTAICDGNSGNFEYTATSTTMSITYDATVTDRAGVSVTGATNDHTYGPYTSAYFAGDAALCGSDWSKTDCPMTLENGVFSITFNNVAAGTYYYKVIGNGSWDNDYVYGLRDAEQSGNGVITVAEADSIVTVTFNQSTYAVEVIVSAPASNPTEEATTEAPSTEAPTTEAPSTEAPSTEAPTGETQDESAEAPTSGEGTGTGSDVESGDSNVGMICGILALLAAAGMVTVVVAKKRIVEE